MSRTRARVCKQCKAVLTRGEARNRDSICDLCKAEAEVYMFRLRQAVEASAKHEVL